MDEARVLETLRRMNRWWADGRVPNELTRKFKRAEFAKAYGLLDLERAIVIIGARRVGKTVILHQMIESLLQSRQKENILYAQMDHPNLRDIGLEDMLSLFRRHMQPAGRIYVFLDEIQYVSDWSLWIKSIYDRKEQAKFVLSGSAASTLKKGSDSLLGRSAEIEMHPLSFSEFAAFKGFKALIGPGVENLSKTGLMQYLKHKDSAEPLLVEYMLRGGFPETFGIESDDFAQELLRQDITEKAIYRDIVLAYGIKTPEMLEGVFTYLCFNTSRIMNIGSAAGDLGIDKATLSNYLGYLKSAFLVYEAKNYSRSMKRVLGSMSKFYVCDTGLINSVTSYGDSIFVNEDRMGMLMETTVFNHCHTYARQKGAKVFYWRDKQKREVDVVMKLGKKIIPIEVKYRNKVGKRDLAGLERFMDEFNTNGIVVTRDTFKQDGRVLYVPAWMFLLAMK